MKIKWGRVLLGLVLLFGACSVALFLSAGRLSNLLTSLDSDSDGGRAGQRSTVGRPAGGGDTGAPDFDADAAAAVDPAAAIDASDLPPFRVLTLAYTPYMVTLAHMDAGNYLERLGWNLELFDVYSDKVSLDEQGQCDALRDGTYDALATTLDATRKCGPGAVMAIPVGQSAGNDAIVVKPGVETWSDIFQHAIAFTEGSVSEYMACFASHTAGVPIGFPIPVEDASLAVDAWLEGGEQAVLSVVAWEPEVSRALAAVPGSRAILSSREVRILWDVINFSSQRAESDPAAFYAFTRAYYEALRDLTRDPVAAARRIEAWADGDPDREALLTVTDPTDLIDDLELEAFATLRDAAILMEDEVTLRNRLEESEFYWRHCNVDVPPLSDVGSLIAPDFVLEAREDNTLQMAGDQRPSSMVFQVTDFTNRDVISDQEIALARQLFATGVEIEFLPNRTDFRQPEEAQAVLRDAVRFLRTCSDCYLEVQGSSAFPVGAERVGFTLQVADELAVARGRRVFTELLDRFDVPPAQLRFIESPRQRLFPGSNNEQELRQDRRTYLTGYQLPGGL